MGIGYYFLCQHCSHQQKVLLGTGDKTEQQKFSLLQEAQKTEAERLFKKSPEFANVCEHRMYSCPFCHYLYGHFYLKINKDEEVLFETSFSCPECQAPLNHIIDKSYLDNFRCEKCKETGAIFGLHFTWE
jgi:transcription initiation factor IIE alpha subunit